MVVETKEINGYTIEILNDCSSVDNPRDWDNLGIMVLFHKRYSMPVETPLDTNDYNSWDEVHNAITKMYGRSLIIPVYMYDHSGISLNTTGFNCPWDSGQLGFIFVPYSRIRETYGCKRVTKKYLDRSRKTLESEVEVYGYYINGDV